MSGTRERLIYMANQIARNFEMQAPDHAAAAVADHIAKFWDPRMKAMIFVEEGGELSPIAASAVAMLRDKGAPPPQTPATEFAAVDETGHSDAG